MIHCQPQQMYAKWNRISRQCTNRAWDCHRHPCNKVNYHHTCWETCIVILNSISFSTKAAGIQTAPQPYYQPSQFGGMSAIPSPPAVLYNSTPMPSQYGHYERYIASAHYGAAGNTGKWFWAKRIPIRINKNKIEQFSVSFRSVQPHTMHHTCKVDQICKQLQLQICIKTWHHNIAWAVQWINHRTINNNSWAIRAPYWFHHHRILLCRQQWSQHRKLAPLEPKWMQVKYRPFTITDQQCWFNTNKSMKLKLIRDF